MMEQCIREADGIRRIFEIVSSKELPYKTLDLLQSALYDEKETILVNLIERAKMHIWNDFKLKNSRNGCVIGNSIYSLIILAIYNNIKQQKQLLPEILNRIDSIRQFFKSEFEFDIIDNSYYVRKDLGSFGISEYWQKAAPLFIN